MNAEILTVGTELLLGDILNSNSQFLSRELAIYGIDTLYQSTVGDNRERLESTLAVALSRCDMVVLTGGYQLTEGITNDRHGMIIINNEKIIDIINGEGGEQ